MTNPAPTSSAAPADQRIHPPWSRAAKVLAYAVFLAVAVASIWFIDRRVDALADTAGPALRR